MLFGIKTEYENGWKDIPIVAREATFLISLATEEFIKRLSEAAQKGANRENRATVQHKDIGTTLSRQT